MGSPFLIRMRRYPFLGDEDLRVLRALTSGRTRTVAARTEIAPEGGGVGTVRILRQGWACRYRSLPDGRRQILSFMLPGDACCLSSHLPGVTDHALASITPLTVSEVPRSEVRAAAAARPGLADAFGWAEAATLSIQREWTLSLGQRNAHERLAHLLCELHLRLDSVGMTAGGGFLAPLTQVDVADALGMSSVHVSRILKDLRDDGLVRGKSRTVNLPNLREIHRFARFSPGYLMLDPAAWLAPDAPVPPVPGR